MPRKKAVPIAIAAAQPGETGFGLPPAPGATVISAATRVPLNPDAREGHEQRQREKAEREARDAATPVYGGPAASARKRIPLGTRMAKLDADSRPGFRRRWFNDDGTRIKQALDAGYSYVIDPETGSNRAVQYGANARGMAATQVLMEIPEEFFQEDFLTKQEKMNAKEAGIYTHMVDPEPGDRSYMPKSTPTTIRVQTGSGRG